MEDWKNKKNPTKNMQSRWVSKYSFPPNNFLGVILKCIISTHGLGTWWWFKRYRDKCGWWWVSFRWNGLLWFSSNCVSSSASIIFFKNTCNDWQLLLLSLTRSNISVWGCKTSIIPYVAFRLHFVRDCSPQMIQMFHTLENLCKFLQIPTCSLSYSSS
jgi:hypothetical protein